MENNVQGTYKWSVKLKNGIRVLWVTENRDGFLGTPREVSSKRGYRRGVLKGTSQGWDVSSWYFRPEARLGWIQVVVDFAGWEGGHLCTVYVERKGCFHQQRKQSKAGEREGDGVAQQRQGSKGALEGLCEWGKGRQGQAERLRYIRKEASSRVPWRREKKASGSGGQIIKPYTALGNLSDP